MVTSLAVLILIYWASEESLAKYVGQNEVVLVQFWGTWCPTCTKDFDKTLEAARKYPKAKILMIALSDKPSAVRAVTRDKRIPKNVLLVIWRGPPPVKTVPTFRAYYKGKMVLETNSLDKMRRLLE